MCHGQLRHPARGGFFLSEGHCKDWREKVHTETESITQYVRPESEECFCLRNITVQIPMYIMEVDVKSPGPAECFLLYLNAFLAWDIHVPGAVFMQLLPCTIPELCYQLSPKSWAAVSRSHYWSLKSSNWLSGDHVWPWLLSRLCHLLPSLPFVLHLCLCKAGTSEKMDFVSFWTQLTCVAVWDFSVARECVFQSVRTVY